MTPHGTEKLAGLSLNRRSFLLGALAFGGAGVLGLTGCSSRETQPAPTPSTGGNSEQITITDQFDRTVTLNGPIERIATTIIPLPAMLIAMDRSLDKVVAVNTAAQKLAEAGFLATMFPKILDLPAAANGADFVSNIETIVAQKPDVAIQWGHYGQEIITPIEQAGLDLLLLNYGDQKMLEEWITILSTLVGAPERGEQVLETMHGDQERIHELVRASGERPRAINIYNFDEMRVSAAGSYMDWWLNLCGAENPAAETLTGSSVATTREEILLWDPEVIFLGNFSTATPETLYNDPFWAEVTAVRNRRVYRLPNGGFSWDPPSTESNMSWLWVAGLLHPDAANFDLRTEMKTHFSYLYDHDLAEDEIDQILFMEANQGSANYDVFAR